MDIKVSSNKRSLGLILLISFLIIAIVLTTIWHRESGNGVLHKTRSVASVITNPVVQTGHWVFSPVASFRSWTSSLFSDRREAKELRAENKELRATVMTLEEARLEAERLRSLLELKNALEMESTGARIIGTSLDNWSAAIRIYKGTKDGIEVGMPVVASQGLIGKVIEVDRFSATVQLIEDSNSGVAAMIQSNREEGVIVGAGDGRLHLNFISRDVEVKAGDVVISSGLGGVFPKGLTIGEVTQVDKRGGGVYQSIIVKQAADVSHLEEVLVLTSNKKADTSEGGQ